MFPFEYDKSGIFRNNQEFSRVIKVFSYNNKYRCIEIIRCAVIYMNKHNNITVNDNYCIS